MKIQNNQINLEASDMALLSDNFRNYFTSQSLVAETELSTFINSQIANYAQSYRQSQLDALIPLCEAIVDAPADKAAAVDTLLSQTKQTLGVSTLLTPETALTQ